jgi:dipeptidyl aminopeptidase/acylaminoacyl peptidase
VAKTPTTGNHVRTAPYGSWKSPITSDLIVTSTVTLSQIQLDGDDTYWTELRPAEGGRTVLVRRTPDGRTEDVTPPPYNVRTRVHEYGGRSYIVADGAVYFSNFADQRIYRTALGAEPQQPEPITPDLAMRYADYVFDARRQRLICVREDHSAAGQEAANTVVSVALGGTPKSNADGEQTLLSGRDFYSAPRLSPDGSRLAWLMWDHPNMPWDGCELWVASVEDDGTLGERQRIAGGENESIFQPEWSPDGALYFTSDRTNWWNLYRWRHGTIEPVHEQAAEFGTTLWQLGMSTYAFVSAERILCIYTEQGTMRLALLDTRSGALETLDLPYTVFSSPVTDGRRALFVAGSPTTAPELVQLDLTSRQTEALRRSSAMTLDPRCLSTAESIEFPTEGGKTAYGFFYRPRNPDYQGPAGEKPPLIVSAHGGPTGMTTSMLNLQTQYWTSRGFAVLDVNYGGSAGYGREFRERLRGQWGVVDVDDCVNGARYLVERGDVDGDRLIITGGSAGGYTTLAALAFRDVFKAGNSLFGLSDLEVFVGDTHKFESRYLHGLIGPYPEAQSLYRERSPLASVDQISVPVILFQGLEDRVVPPNQAELIVETLRRKGQPVAYIAYEGEGHGFRRAENIKRTLDAALYFYGRIFGFDPADAIEPVVIENLAR